MSNWLSRGRDNIWLPYTQMKTANEPLAVASADGVRLKLSDGRELVDGIASWWTAVHGYNHPHIVKAVTAQAELMPHVMFGGLVNEPAVTLASRLAGLAPGDLNRVFFAESGSVSVEVAMKMAVQYWKNRGETNRTKFLSFYGNYHGDTGMTMAVCDPEEGMHTVFSGYVEDQFFAHLPRTDEDEGKLDEMLAAHKDKLAGILVEPLVQGAGGMVFHGADVLQKIRDAADRHGLLLIADEIFTGFGRTGTMFACEQAGIVPDIMTLSKALTGGTMPLSCAIAREHVFEAFYDDDPEKAFMHGPTYMGNALACAAANASLDLFENEPRLEQAKAISSQMEKELEPCRDISGVKNVRTQGAIGVVELEKINDVESLKKKFVEKGVWVRPFGNIVYLTPPLVIEPDDLSQLTSAIGGVLKA